MWSTLKHVVIGSPLETMRQTHERLSKKVALAVFSSDALSSVAYATDEILHVLVLGGLAARRSDASTQSVLQAGELQMGLQRRAVHLSGDEIHLTPTEFEILRMLLTNLERKVSLSLATFCRAGDRLPTP